MPTFPTELLTLTASSLFAGLMRLWARAQEARLQERLSTLQALNAKSAIIDQARRYNNTGFQWTRRIISLTAVFFIIALPKLAPLLFPDMAIHIGYPQMKSGFLFFTSDTEHIQWTTLQGIAITPLDTHLLSAVIGLYFGGSLAGR